jgi:hypothetical protein
VTGRHVQLWGGPEDGAVVFMDGGDLPPRVGTHRTAAGHLVPIRSRALNLGLPLVADHVAVYEHVTLDVLRLWRAAVGEKARLFDPAGHSALEDVPLYVWRELVTHWTARQA